MTYSYAELKAAYAALGVGPGRVVFLRSAVKEVADYEERGGRALVQAHFNALTELLGPTGTLVVPTTSTNLCNTDVVFDPATTPSHMAGGFSEFVRQQPGARRSFHPFMSYAAIGARAEEIVGNVCRHAFTPGTPEWRMLAMGTLCVSVGLPPPRTCSTVHVVEQVMGVPYRYTKEFLHPVLRDGQVVREPFYLYVWYRDSGLERDGNLKLWDRIGPRVPVSTAPIGRGMLYAWDQKAFFDTAIEEFEKDIYAWLRRPPEAADPAWRK